MRINPNIVPDLANNLLGTYDFASQSRRNTAPYIVIIIVLLRIMPYMGARTFVPQSPGKKIMLLVTNVKRIVSPSGSLF
jgi:hypothetical protein